MYWLPRGCDSSLPPRDWTAGGAESGYRKTGYEEVQQMSGYGSSGERREGVSQAKNDIAQKTSDVVDQAKEQTGQAMDQVRGSAFQMMDQQKQRAADGLGSVASALHQTGDSLQGGDQGAIGQYAHRAADTVDQLAQQIRDKDVEQLLSEAENFARREPEVFLGGAVLLGLLASRFLKASARRSQMRNRDYGNYGYGSQYGRGYQGDYGRMGPGGYDRDSWNDEGISYRSAGTGGYRTSISSGAGTESYGEMSSGSISASDLSVDRERAQRRPGTTGSQFEDGAWSSDEEDLPGTGTGSGQA
jgi:hypothetical protein